MTGSRPRAAHPIAAGLRTAPPRLLLLAGAVTVLGLALPWRNSHLDTGLTTAYLPGYCHISYDGYSYCETGSIGWGTYSAIKGPVPGFAGSIRVVAVLAALLLWWAWRHRSPIAARCGLAVAAFGVVVGGFTMTAGRLVFVGALLLAALALDQRGLLRPDRQAGAAQVAAST